MSNLDARAERVLARARGQHVPHCYGDILFALEDDAVRSVPRDAARFLLTMLGVSETFEEIEAGRKARPATWIPIVIIVGGYVRSTFIETHEHAPGRVA